MAQLFMFLLSMLYSYIKVYLSIPLFINASSFNNKHTHTRHSVDRYFRFSRQRTKSIMLRSWIIKVGLYKNNSSIFHSWYIILQLLQQCVRILFAPHLHQELDPSVILPSSGLLLLMRSQLSFLQLFLLYIMCLFILWPL